MSQETPKKVTKSGLITCWSCKKRMSLMQHHREDGFCPHCLVEVDITGAPYVDEEPEKT